jgi:hypothetical protein
MKNIYSFFDKLTNTYSVQDISKYLGLNKNTVQRWIEKEEVPFHYYFDLCRLSGIEIDYSQYSEKEKDQFFTSKNTAKYCLDKMKSVLSEFDVNESEYHLIEPSAGDGSFYDLLPEDRRIGIDIEPRKEGIIKSDFLLWEPTTEKNICVGNPPFGLRGHLALQFINHAATFSDFVCFILPQLFDSEGKGSCKKRVKGLNLIHSEFVDSNFYYPDGKNVSVNCVFQIWSKNYKLKEKKVDLSGIIKLYSLSDGGTPSSTRNKKYLNSCDYYLPSTCFGEENIRVYDNFENLPHRRGYGIVVQTNNDTVSEIISSINWKEVSFRSTNGAYNLRFDLIERAITDYAVTNKVKFNDTIGLDKFFS